MDDLRDKVAVVTGAARGIGRALATQLSGFGCQVTLCDLDEAGLEETRAACERLGARASSRALDASEAAVVFAWADDVVARHGAPYLVFNNAGATLVATVENLTLEELQWLMGVNFWGVVHGTKAFLPRMEAAGGRHIVNISSAFGLIGNPGQAAYTPATASEQLPATGRARRPASRAHPGVGRVRR
jgi:NAD(P)-dependent dehydrogenase (short-subunit alcohol dehydrogenase family)